MNIRDWLSSATQRIEAEGIPSARLEAQVLLAFALGVNRTWLLAHPEHELSDDIDATKLLERRLTREPLAYITGEREFYGRTFTVSPETLIPRQDTETLVQAALECVSPGAAVLDVGTGSGCIAITLKLERPDCEVTALDLSPGALEIAASNARALDAYVGFLQSDLLASVEPQSIDVIVSNPPYVELDADLAPEVRLFEPPLALYSGQDGLDAIRRLVADAPRVLRPSGWLLLEVGHQQADSVLNLWPNVASRTWSDLSGIVRVVGFHVP